MTTPAVLDEPETTTPTDALPDTASPEPVDAFDDDEDDEGFADTGDGEGPEASAEPAEPETEPIPEPVEAFEDLIIENGAERYVAPGIKIDRNRNQITAASPAAMQAFLNKAGRGRAFETTYRPEREKMVKQLAQKDQEIERAASKADGLVGAYGNLMALPEDEAVAQFRKDWLNWPQAQLSARERELAEREQRLNAPRTDDAGPGVVIEDVAEWARALAGKMLREASASAMPWLTEDAIRDLEPALTDPDEQWNAKVVRYATEEDVAANPKLTLGQFMFDGPRFQSVLKRYEAPYVKAQAATRDAQKQLQTLGTVAKTNARILAVGTPPAAAKTKAPPSTQQQPANESREDRREREEREFRAHLSDVGRELRAARR